MELEQIVHDGFYSESIGAVRTALSSKRTLENKKAKYTNQLYESQSLYVKMLDAQKLLSTVSDDNTEKTLDFITGMVNKVLSEMFVTDVPSIRLHKKLYAGSKPHINVELMDGSGHVLDMNLQSGVGLGQVVSFMYAICLIEIRKNRRLLILDERLNGLHKEAKRVLEEIIKIFSRGGFQFVFVEYGLNGLGKIYNVEKRGTESNVVSLDGKDYDDSKVYIDDVDLSVLDKSYSEDVSEEEVLT